jgi:hypothetical protein
MLGIPGGAPGGGGIPGGGPPVIHAGRLDWPVGTAEAIGVEGN